MPLDSDRYDFFVSYARRDNVNGWITGFVEGILAEQTAFRGGRKLTCFFDQSDIRNGDDWQHRIQHGVAESRVFLAFISPHYFASEWCRREWRAWVETEIAKHVFSDGAVPVYIAQVPGLEGASAPARTSEEIARLCDQSPPDELFVAEASPLIHQLRRRQLRIVHSFFSEGLPALRRDDLRYIFKALASDLYERAERVRRAGYSANTVPPYNKRFSGRVDELLALRERLKNDQAGVVCGVNGLGGMGKTELAFAYAHAFASVYPGGRFLLSCEGKTTIREAVLELDTLADFRALISDEERNTPDALFSAISRCLVRCLEDNGNILLVLDNVTNPALMTGLQTDELTKLGPRLHLLMTTRLEAPPRSNWLTLGEMPAADSLALLEKHRPFTDDDERLAAQRIVKRMGGFAMAVELVAAWLGAHPGSNYRTLADRIGLQDLEIIAVDEKAELRRHNHERRLTAVLEPALAGLHHLERCTLELASFLPPDSVPLPWLKLLVKADNPKAFEVTGLISDPWAETVYRLTQLALLSGSGEGVWRVRLHRLVQEVVKRSLSSERVAECEQTVEDFVRKRDSGLSETANWMSVGWELEAMDAMANSWAETRREGAAWLLNQAALRWAEVAEWARAEPLLERAHAIDEARNGKDHIATAVRLNNLGHFLKETNRLKEAEPLIRRAIAIAEATYSADDPAMSLYLNNLALILFETNRMNEAESLMRRTLAVDEASYGKNHPTVALRLNNLAMLLEATNRLSEAEPLLRRALAIYEASYAEDHPAVARALSNLAVLLQAANRSNEAESLLKRALAIYEASYGKDHPDVARVLHNMAMLLQNTNRLSEAEPLLRRALAIDEASFGKDHPRVATNLTGIARMLVESNRPTEAEPLILSALAIDEASFGKDHPGVARDLTLLTQVLDATNRLSEAEPLVRRALAIDEASFGKDHPRLATHLRNLVDILHEKNSGIELEPLIRRALAIDEQSFGKDHPVVGVDLNSLSQLLQDTNRLCEAEPILRRALVIDEVNYGEDHPAVAIRLNKLARLLRATSRSGEAEPLIRRALAIDEKSFGKEHVRVANDLNELADLLLRTSRQSEVEPLIRRALGIHEVSYGKDAFKVADDLNVLSQLLLVTGRWGEAEPLVTRALAIDEASLGKDHPRVARDLTGIAHMLIESKRPTEAEPLILRALAIDEATYGERHPEVATDLNNLARLLVATNRKREAEPLMKRALDILLNFTRTIQYEHPLLRLVVANYCNLLKRMNLSHSEILETLSLSGPEAVAIRIEQAGQLNAES